MKLSKCCDAEIKFGMVDDRVGHGIHEETECSNCGELFPEEYDDEEEKDDEEEYDDEEEKESDLLSFYKDKQSGEVLDETELDDVVDMGDNLDSFYLIGDFKTKEEAINHLNSKA
jgi:hypothetical protein